LGREAVEAEEHAEKEMMDNAGKKRRRDTGRNPNHDTGAQK
jgi:hypothetical protein